MMTDRKQTLTDLRDKVNEGNECTHTFAKVYPVATKRNDWLHDAFNGSIDAAKALHEAVLPGWGWHVRQDEKDGSCHAHTLYPKFRVSPGGHTTESNPARAWLLAILEALIAQESA